MKRAEGKEQLVLAAVVLLVGIAILGISVTTGSAIASGVTPTQSAVTFQTLSPEAADDSTAPNLTMAMARLSIESDVDKGQPVLTLSNTCSDGRKYRVLVVVIVPEGVRYAYSYDVEELTKTVVTPDPGRRASRIISIVTRIDTDTGFWSLNSADGNANVPEIVKSGKAGLAKFVWTDRS